MKRNYIFTWVLSVSLNFFAGNISNAQTISTQPQYGGVVFNLGDFRAEVFVQPDDRQVQAIFSKVRPNPIPFHQLQLNVTCSCENGIHETTTLHWNATEHLFMGYLNCNTPVPGPLSVTLLDGQQTFRGFAPMAATIPTPRYGGYVLGAGPFVFELLPWSFGVAELVPRSAETYRAFDHLEINMTVPIATDDTQSIEMRWDKKRHRFVGQTPMKVALKYGAIHVAIHDVCNQVRISYYTGIEAAMPLLAPKMGGALISTGTYIVELNATSSGVVEGIVLDRFGKRPSAAHVQLVVNALDKDGNVYPIAMNWNSSRNRFYGFLKIKSTQVFSYYAKVRGGDAVSRDPYQAMNNLIGRIRIRNIDEEWRRSRAIRTLSSNAKTCIKDRVKNQDREDKYDRNSKSPFL